MTQSSTVSEWDSSEAVPTTDRNPIEAKPADCGTNADVEERCRKVCCGVCAAAILILSLSGEFCESLPL